MSQSEGNQTPKIIKRKVLTKSGSSREVSPFSGHKVAKTLRQPREDTQTGSNESGPPGSTEQGGKLGTQEIVKNQDDERSPSRKSSPEDSKGSQEDSDDQERHHPAPKRRKQMLLGGRNLHGFGGALITSIQKEDDRASQRKLEDDEVKDDDEIIDDVENGEELTEIRASIRESLNTMLLIA